ncbi:MAG: SPOR domain-containing protein, partial [Pseudomonadota bacterium]|nr:SPOR domain-containing protein [Pseudomonadota bacterium]
VYRLRASAGAEASTICGRLKVAGESCLVVN